MRPEPLIRGEQVYLPESTLRSVVACCLPACAKGLSVPAMEYSGNGVFCAFLLLFCVLCIWRVLVLLVSLLCTRLGLLWCASCWTRPLGGSRWGHYLCNLQREYFKIHNIAFQFFWFKDVFINGKLYMLALVGQPSQHGYDACMVYWSKGAHRRICRLKQRESSFSFFQGFLLSRNSLVRFWCVVVWHLWIGRARHPGPSPSDQFFGLEVFNVGSWLTHCDFALEAQVDFLAVVEHRLIPARVRSEWDRLRRKGGLDLGSCVSGFLPCW